ncbi:hypothetical protein WSM22_31070 [Cytophagales bacterium WSM2-2]|nr:hypothetical protein WSM22_31070 [Cytophagales bacterium WSM2-2]
MNRIEWMEKYMASAEQLIRENRVDEGLNALHNLLYDEPGYGNLHNYLGWAYMYFTEDAGKAELHLKMAIRFESDYAAPYQHMGCLLNRLGRYSEAIEYFRAGLTKGNANRVAMLEGIAIASELRNEYALAIRYFKDAMRASAVDTDIDRLAQGIKRCRRKRLAFFFTF